MRFDPKRFALGSAEFAVVVLVYLGAAGMMTWPAIAHVDEIIIGGGELGGWLWRYWWHFTEVDALVAGDFSLLDRIYTYLSLGRHPETGNILDVLWISWPLSKVFPIPAHYNLKIFIILVGDGLFAYLFARSFTPYRLVALAAGLVAVVNPLNVHDLYGSGLRQVVLWFLLVFPLLLDRAERREKPLAGIAAGACLGLVGAFYWFYGLFAGMFLVLWSLDLVWRERRRLDLRRLIRWAGPMILATVVVAGIFVAPYVIGEPEGASVGGQQRLPELSFFLTFPEYDVIREVPLRPDTYEENVLASLNRTLSSSWSVDYLFNPGHKRALPMVVFLGGVLPALLLKPGIYPRSRFWLLVFAVFWLGTLGPFVKWAGFGEAWGEVVLLPLGDGFYTLRMPYTLMFKWVPGMSRMFAPYRMGSMVVVAAVALVAMGLSRITHPKVRGAVAVLAIAATLFQANFRWHVDEIAETDIAPTRFLPAIPVSAIQVPDFYKELPVERAGIIELPLEQQQDLLNYYQLVHGRKVFRSWASRPAIPPLLRDGGGGEPGDQLRYLARRDLDTGPTPELFLELSRQPEEAAIETLDREDFDQLVVAGNYKHLIVHERGFYLVDPQRGALLYNDVVRRLSGVLGVFPEEVVELQYVDYPGNPYHDWGPVRVPWSSYEVVLPDRQMPNRFFMSIFDLQHIHDSWEGPDPAELLPKESSGGGGAGGDGPAHQEHVHQEMPPGAPLQGATDPGEQ